MTLAHCAECGLWLRPDQSCLHIAADGFGQDAERDREIRSAAADPSSLAAGMRGAGPLSHTGTGLACLSAPFHAASNSGEAERDHA